jgi:hexosaminidase
VAYARDRFITVIPEIEMPGHSLAALAAYPELACTPGPFETATSWGGFKDIFCPKDSTFRFLENVLNEVMDLFPPRYIHIGGDEVDKDRWKESPDAQAVIRREGLKDENELQSYFVRRMEQFINSKGRRMIGWDEILEGGLAPDATVMSWRGEKGGIEAARQGHDVIMTPGAYLYFDYYQGDRKKEPLAIGGNLPLEKVYSYNPTPAVLNAEEKKHILGAQANVWTEYMADTRQVEYMLFPRLFALAEVVWSAQDARSYRDFLNRVPPQLARLKRQGVNYRALDRARMPRGSRRLK